MDGLLTATNTDDTPSYHGYNGCTSKIDYILAHKDSCFAFGIQIEDIKIISHICKETDPSIISTHDAFYFEVKLTHYVNKEQNTEIDCKSTKIVNKRIDWESADLPKYQATLESLLGQSFQLWHFPENIQVLASVIPSTFMHAAEISLPSKLLLNLQVGNGQELANQGMKKVNYTKPRKKPTSDLDLLSRCSIDRLTLKRMIK